MVTIDQFQHNTSFVIIYPCVSFNKNMSIVSCVMDIRSHHREDSTFSHYTSSLGIIIHIFAVSDLEIVLQFCGRLSLVIIIRILAECYNMIPRNCPLSDKRQFRLVSYIMWPGRDSANIICSTFLHCRMNTIQGN